MTDHNTHDKSLTGHTTLTGDVKRDIVLLSTLLIGKQVTGPTSSRDPDNKELSLLAYLSDILTIGSDDSPKALSVHAITGKITGTQVECVVCAENQKQGNPPGKAEPFSPPPGKLVPISLDKDHTRGRLLLSNWGEAVG